MELPLQVSSGFVLLTIISWLLAVLVFISWKKTRKPSLVYVHLGLILLPLLQYATSLPCSMPWFSSLVQFCSIMWTKLIIYLIPITIVTAIIIGYFMLPRFYIRYLRAKELSVPSIKNAKVYLFDAALPTAFSIRNYVFISQGIFELLNKKEREAILLHELYHVMESSGWKKFSTAIVRIISPLSNFSTIHPNIEMEESNADEFAIKLQGTGKYIESAKKRIIIFENEQKKFISCGM